MNKPLISIVLPVYSARDEGVSDAEMRHYRAKQVQRAIKSIIAQQHPSWELIIVDDGCTDETPGILDKFAKLDKRIKVYHKVNENRAIARNYGMERATGDWIAWIDSDDEYSTNYVRIMAQAIEEFPEYKIFNHGAIVYWPDFHTSLRSVFAPAVEGDGHQWFRSGQIGCGSFVFRRDVWSIKRINQGERPWLNIGDEYQPYRIPDEVNTYEFAAKSHFPLKLDPVDDEFQYSNTVNPEEAFQDGVYRHGLSLGNPWADDSFQFYLLTRDNHSKPLDVLLYIQYPRAHEEIYKHFGEIYD